MADNGKKTPEKIGKLVYPFQKSPEPGKTGTKAADIDDPKVYFDALSQAGDGFYPIGANGQWHGGIHFDAQTKQTLSQDDGIRCIGVGEVVAYQVDSKYPTTDYSTGKAKYSRGFVLVRHRLELPVAPKKTTDSSASGASGNTTPAANQPSTQSSHSDQQEEPSLIFYSVYLHLLDWEGYKKLDAEKARPAFWGQAVYIVGEKANDSDRSKNAFIPEGGVGLNLRDAQGSAAGYAARGAKLELGAENPQRKGYFAVKRVVSGTTNPAEVTSLYAFKKELDSTSEPATLDTVHLLDEPAEIKPGELVGYLGQYERYMDTNPLANSRPRELVQLDVFTAEDIKAFMAKSRERAKQLDAKQKTLLKIDKGAKLALPGEPDQQISSEEGAAVVGQDDGGAWVQVKKGSLQIMDKGMGLSGFKEATMAYDGGQVLHRLLGDNDSDSIPYSQYKALNKQDQAKYARRQVLVPTGNPLWVERGQLGSERVASGREIKAWSQFPLKVGQGDGPEVGFIRVAAIKHLKKSVSESDGTRWWEVDVGTLDGSTRLGWAREKDHTRVELCSPWDWPGFEHVEADTTTPEKLYVRHVVVTKQARPDERAALEARAAEADGGPLFSRLCDVIDLDDDRVLTPDELRNALKQPWKAEAISRLIVHHTSEWGTPAEQWKAIDNDIPESRKADWDKEKQRIQSLQWWDQVKTDPALPADAKIYHFQPIGLISNFTNKDGKLTLEMLKAVFESSSVETAKLQSFVDEINENIEDYKLDTNLRLSHFFAQVREEAGSNARTVENLDYSPEGLKGNFSYFRRNPSEAELYGRTAAHPANQEAIANRAYSNREGHGDPSLGEGWKYRGRGLKQLTWKGNYQSFQDNYRNVWPEESPDFINNPDLLVQPKYAVRSAVYFWLHNKLYEIADKGATDANVNSITAIINKDTDSYAARRSHFKRIWDGKIFEPVGD